MKLEITELNDLFTVIEKQVKASSIPEKQKRRTATNLKNFANHAFQLGVNGKVEIEVKDPS